jgi:hypothetical protein
VGEALAVEDVTQVAAAGRAQNFDAAAIGVGLVADGAGELLVEAGPAAAGVELAVGAVEGGVAPAADIDAGLKEVVVFASEGPLGALMDDDALFSGGEWV